MNSKAYLSGCIFLLFFAQSVASAKTSLVARAKNLMAQHNYPEASRLLQKIAFDDLDADKGIAANLLVTCLYGMQRYQDVIEFAERYLKENPQHFETRLMLVRSLVAQGDSTKALLESESLIKIHSQNESAICLRAKLLSADQKTSSSSIDLLTNFLKANPSANKARETLANIYFNLDQVPLALKEATIVAKQGPITADLYNLLGRIEFQMGEYNLAKEHFRFAQKLNPQDVTASIELGHLHSFLGDFPKATAVLSKAMDSVEENGKIKVLLEVARLQMKQGFFESARETIYRADAIQPGSEKAQYLLTQSFVLQKNTSEAAQVLEKFTEQFPSRNWAILARARLLDQNADEKNLSAWITKHIEKSENPNELREFLANKNSRTAQRLPAGTPRYEVVKVGDTLSSISRRIFGKSGFWQAIFEWNRSLLSNPNALREGMQLKICREAKCEK